MTKPGDILVLEAPVAIYYRRSVVPADGQAEWSDRQFHSSSTEPRQSRLAQLFSATGGLSPQQSYLLFHPRTTVDWRSAGQAEAEMERLLLEQATSIQALVVDAQRRSLVHASGMRLAIRTTVEDVRRDRSVPVPVVAPQKWSSRSGLMPSRR
jgi:hypothetical protein